MHPENFFSKKSHKSVGIAIMLTLLLGPVGLFYASVTGGLIMTFLVPILLVILSFVTLFMADVYMAYSFIGLLLIGLSFWFLNIIWAVIAVNNYNKDVDLEFSNQMMVWNKLSQTNSNNPTIAIKLTSELADQKKNLSDPNLRNSDSSRTIKPPLQEWLALNPRKSINDYYSKFGT